MTSVTALATSAVGVLLAIDPVPDDEDVRPGQAYAWIIIGLIVVLVLLWLSLRRHLRRINLGDDDSTERTDDPARRGQDDESAGHAG